MTEITRLNDPAELNRLQDKARLVLDEAARQGADQAEVGINGSRGFSVSVRMGEVETLEFHNDRGFSVTVYLGQCKGSASSTDDSPQSIRDSVAAALAIARQTRPDQYAGIAPAELLASDVPDLDLCHPWQISPEEAIDSARECEAVGRADPRIINSEGASLSTGISLRVYANSHGFLAGYSSSSHSRACILVAEQDGKMQRDYWYDGRRNAADLADAKSIGQRAAERTLSRLGATRPPTGNMPVMFAPEVAGGVLGHLVGAISGGSLYRRASFLCDRLGETIFPDWVNISERPLAPGLAGSAPFDSDGLATRNQSFISDGKLVSYALGLYAARRLDMQPTGNGGGVRNLTISHGDEDQQALLKRMGNGLLVTELMGSGVNLLTGDYSRGASGFLVENGEIVAPLEEFTIAGHLGEMFAGLQAAGNDVDTRGNIHCGSLLLSEMKVAGS